MTVVALRHNSTSSDADPSRKKASSVGSVGRELEQMVRVPPLSFPSLRQWAQRLNPDIWVPLMTLVGFSATTFLVFAAEPTNFLLFFDHSVQNWTVSTIPSSIRYTVFQKGISNIFFVFDFVVGSSLIFIHGLGKRKKELALTGFSALFFYVLMGSHNYEGWVIHFLKETFHRCRPQSGMISYSFPSGHVTCAVFLTGTLLYVWLPAAERSLNTDSPSFVRRYVEVLRSGMGNKMLFWGLSYLCTSVGRVGGNVHWVSDTIAGGLVGMALTSLLVSSYTALYNRIDKV